MLTSRSGGWVLLLTVVVLLMIAVWWAVRVLPTVSQPAVGDGVHLDSYGFDLSALRVERRLLVPAGDFLRKDGLPAPVDPPTIAASEFETGSKLGGVRKLLDLDRVIGVAINGAARAYPLWVMDWHEIVNDTLGGEPILVTYSPLCDSTVVFERRVDGRVATFGHSGLVYNSNTVMFDRRESPSEESLWCQLRFEAIAGPAAERGERLTLLPAAVVPWAVWRAAHPETTILLPSEGRRRLYRRDAYGMYFESERLMFPVEPLPGDGTGRGWKSRVVVLHRLEAGAATSDHRLETGPVGQNHRMETGAAVLDQWRVLDAETFGERAELEQTPVAHAFWFAWYAMWGGE